MRSLWRTVRWVVFVVIGVGCTILAAWAPAFVDSAWARDGKVWVEERHGLFWLVRHTNNEVHASAYRTEHAARQILEEELATGSRATVVDGEPPTLPDWCHFREAVVTPDMLIDKTTPNGWAGAGSAYVRTGWPWPALTGGQTNYVPPARGISVARRDHLLTLDEGMDVPCKPVWPGLLADVAVFTIIAAVIYRALAAGMRAVWNVLSNRPLPQ